MGLKEKISIDSCQFDFRVLIYTTTTKVESLKKLHILTKTSCFDRPIFKLFEKSLNKVRNVLRMNPIFSEPKTIEFKQ